MTEHVFIDMERAALAARSDKINHIGVSMVLSAVRCWEAQHRAKVVKHHTVARPDVGPGIAEVVFTEVEYAERKPQRKGRRARVGELSERSGV